MSDVRRCKKMSDARRCEKISFICRSIYTSFFLKNPSLRRSREQGTNPMLAMFAATMPTSTPHCTPLPTGPWPMSKRRPASPRTVWSPRTPCGGRGLVVEFVWVFACADFLVVCVCCLLVFCFLTKNIGFLYMFVCVYFTFLLL